MRFVNGEGAPSNGGFPAAQGAARVDNVLIKGDRKDSGSAPEPGQLVRAGE